MAIRLALTARGELAGRRSILTDAILGRNPPPDADQLVRAKAVDGKWMEATISLGDYLESGHNTRGRCSDSQLGP